MKKDDFIISKVIKNVGIIYFNRPKKNKCYQLKDGKGYKKYFRKMGKR